MQNIDGTLYKINKIYRNIVDEMIATENKRVKIQMELERQRALWQAEEARRQAEMNALRGILRSYANPYIIPITHAQQESTRRAIHLAASAAAHISKRQSPVASVILDGFGLITSDNMLDAVKSAVSAADTICNMITQDTKSCVDLAESQVSHQPDEPAEPERIKELTSMEADV